MEEDIDQQEVSNPEETQDSNLEPDVEVNEELVKAQELANNYKIRAEKAEKALKQKSAVEKKEEKTEEVKEIGLSPKDYLALTEHRVSSEEFDKVMEISKLLNKPVAETLQDKTARLILQAYREERATAEATATSGGGRKSGTSVKGKILEDYQKGIKPDTEEGSAALASAQFEQLLKGTK